MENKDTIEIRQEKEKWLLLDQLRKMPIVQVACERTGIGRTTYYRWRKDDETFRATADEALAEGELLLNDMSESQLVSLIKDKSFAAVHLWLRHHHPKYGNKLEVTTRIRADDGELTPEQEALVREALGVPLSNNHDET